MAEQTSLSSLCGVMKSNLETTRQLLSDFKSSMADSYREIDQCIEKSAQEIKQSFARILELLQEEIDASESLDVVISESDTEEIDACESTNIAFPVSGKILPRMEPVDWDSSIAKLVPSSIDSLGVVTIPIKRPPWEPPDSNLFVEIPQRNMVSKTNQPISFQAVATKPVVLNTRSKRPSPEPPDEVVIPRLLWEPDHSFRQLHTKFQRMWKTMVPPPPPELPDANHERVLCEYISVFLPYYPFDAHHDLRFQLARMIEPIVLHKYGVSACNMFWDVFDTPNNCHGNEQHVRIGNVYLGLSIYHWRSITDSSFRAMTVAQQVFDEMSLMNRVSKTDLSQQFRDLLTRSEVFNTPARLPPPKPPERLKVSIPSRARSILTHPRRPSEQPPNQALFKGFGGLVAITTSGQAVKNIVDLACLLISPNTCTGGNIWEQDVELYRGACHDTIPWVQIVATGTSYFVHIKIQALLFVIYEMVEDSGVSFHSFVQYTLLIVVKTFTLLHIYQIGNIKIGMQPKDPMIPNGPISSDYDGNGSRNKLISVAHCGVEGDPLFLLVYVGTCFCFSMVSKSISLCFASPFDAQHGMLFQLDIMLNPPVLQENYSMDNINTCKYTTCLYVQMALLEWYSTILIKKRLYILQEAYATMMHYLYHDPWYVEVINMNYALHCIANWLGERCGYVPMAMFEHIKFQGFLSKGTHNGWNSNNKYWCGLCCSNGFALKPFRDVFFLWGLVNMAWKFFAVGEAQEVLSLNVKILLYKCVMQSEEPKVFDNERKKRVVSLSSVTLVKLPVCSNWTDLDYPCGKMVAAQGVFHKKQNIISWLSAFMGFAHTSDIDLALKSFVQRSDRDYISWIAKIASGSSSGYAIEVFEELCSFVTGVVEGSLMEMLAISCGVLGYKPTFDCSVGVIGIVEDGIGNALEVVMVGKLLKVASVFKGLLMSSTEGAIGLAFSTQQLVILVAIVKYLSKNFSRMLIGYRCVVMTVMLGIWAQCSQMNLVGSNLIVFPRHFKQWDPGGYLCSYAWERFTLLWGHLSITPQYYLDFNLEDKVVFKGEGNVMNRMMSQHKLVSILKLKGWKMGKGEAYISEGMIVGLAWNE